MVVYWDIEERSFEETKEFIKENPEAIFLFDADFPEPLDLPNVRTIISEKGMHSIVEDFSEDIKIYIPYSGIRLHTSMFRDSVVFGNEIIQKYISTLEKKHAFKEIKLLTEKC